MENLFALIVLISLVLLIIGFFSPSTSLFWYKKERTKKGSLFIYGMILIISFVLFGITIDKNKSQQVNDTALEKKIELTQFQKDSIAKINLLSEIEIRKNQTIKASLLTNSYIENEVRADESYKNKSFYVEGVVTDIKKDIMNDIYVTLEGSEMFRQVQCYFDDKETASKLEKGMRVTFYGKCDGLMINVLMKNCKLVDNLKKLEEDLKKKKLE
jgi:hypothetical protein